MATAQNLEQAKNRCGIPSISPGGCVSLAPCEELGQTSSRLSESEQGESRGAQPQETNLADAQFGCHFP